MISGGFEESLGTNDTNLVTTVYAVRGLQALNALSQCDQQSAAQFIAECQAADGSWGNVPELSAGTLANAGLAVQALGILGYTSLLDQEDPNHVPSSLLDWRAVLVLGIILVAAVVACVALRAD
jgi:prenyltransferase beta subunit